MQLTHHFTLRELTRSESAERQGVDNTPGEKAVANLKALCLNVLEPIRTKFQKPISISSGYRSPAANKLIGGSGTSQHCNGEAADFEIFGLSNLTLAKEIVAMGVRFDQLILEFHNPTDPNSGWVHCSYKRDGTNRNQVLTASRVQGKVVYTQGLPA